MTEAELTRLLAIIGAVTGGIGALTGIAALSWEVFTWWRSGRVKLSIVPKTGVAYNGQPFPKISVIINNVGQVRTTIQEVNIYCYKGRLFKEWKGISGGFISDLFPLPVALDPGNSWAGESPNNIDNVIAHFPDNIYYVAVSHSRSARRVFKRLPEPLRTTRTWRNPATGEHEPV
jgi:hypothetical protein